MSKSFVFTGDLYSLIDYLAECHKRDVSSSIIISLPDNATHTSIPDWCFFISDRQYQNVDVTNIPPIAYGYNILNKLKRQGYAVLSVGSPESSQSKGSLVSFQHSWSNFIGYLQADVPVVVDLSRVRIPNEPINIWSSPFNLYSALAEYVKNETELTAANCIRILQASL